MKKIIPFLVIPIFFFTIQFSFGQTTIPKEVKKKFYIVWVTPIDKTPSFEGYLSEVGDTLVVAPRFMSHTVKRISLDNVDYLKFKRIGKMKRSAIAGTLVGLGVGAIVGAITYEECPESDPLSSFVYCGVLYPNQGLYIFGSSMLGGLTGLVVGVIVGKGKITVPIQGSEKSRKAQKEELLKYKFGY